MPHFLPVTYGLGVVCTKWQFCPQLLSVNQREQNRLNLQHYNLPGGYLRDWSLWGSKWEFRPPKAVQLRSQAKKRLMRL